MWLTLISTHGMSRDVFLRLLAGAEELELVGRGLAGSGLSLWMIPGLFSRNTATMQILYNPYKRSCRP